MDLPSEFIAKIEDVPSYILNVMKIWAIHYIDENVQQLQKSMPSRQEYPDFCLKLEVESPSKDITAQMSEIPYKCPHNLKCLKSSWSARRVHQSILDSSSDHKDSKNNKYSVQFFCEAFQESKNDRIPLRNDPCVQLYLRTYMKDETVYGIIVDAFGKIWTPQKLKGLFLHDNIDFEPIPTASPLCFMWHDKNDMKNKLWTINNVRAGSINQ